MPTNTWSSIESTPCNFEWVLGCYCRETHRNRRDNPSIIDQPRSMLLLQEQEARHLDYRMVTVPMRSSSSRLCNLSRLANRPIQ